MMALMPTKMADGTLSSTGGLSDGPPIPIFRVVNSEELSIIVNTGQFPPSSSGFGEKQFWLTPAHAVA